MNRRDVAGGPAAERCAAVVLHGVPGSTLRYHEEKGLIASVGRQSLRRTFDPGVLELLSLISLGQAAGFSLDEIAQMFTTDKRPDIKRQMLEDKANHIDGLVRRLRAMSRGLRHAAVCPAPSHMECPSFRRLLTAAFDGTLDRRLGGRRPM